MGDWFSRPIRLTQIQWAENGSVDSIVAPWYEYFNHPEIYAKIKGFSRMRCKLHVKLIINASPFQYGLGIMAYKPLSSSTRPDFSGGVIHNTVSKEELLMGLTQRMHAHFMPQYSKGCEMELPFIYFKDWVPLEQNLLHLQDMGRLQITSYDVLRTAASTNATPISIALYAWASEVKLAGPSMSLQADEYSERPISTVASAVANAAGALESIPPLAPFARATMMAATAVGRIARFFGFSNPPVIDPVHSMRISYAANLCSPDVPTQIEKLSLDPKNELTVDSRTVGLDGEDHMTLKHILNRDVYFSRFMWGATDAPDAPLWSSYVNPDVSIINQVTATIGNGVRVTMTPSALIGQMFSHWRGPITYKFVAAASQFHRGRLRISYDPNGPWGASELGTARLYQKVWDLSTSNTFEYTVPFMAPSTFLKVFGGSSLAQNGNANRFWDDRAATPALPYNNNLGSSPFWNGCIRLDVMNELTAPSNVDIPIFVYINCGEVDFANPKNMEVDFSTAVLQSDDIMVSDAVTHETIPVVNKEDHVYDVYMGEKVVSTRQLLHRAQLWDIIRPAFAGSPTNSNFDVTTQTWRQLLTKWIFPRLPMPFCAFQQNGSNGNAANFPNWDLFTNGANFYLGCNARTLPITLLTSCYVGWRGSVVWRGFLEKRTDNEKALVVGVKMNREIAPANTLRPNTYSGSSVSTTIWNTMRGGQVTRWLDFASATLAGEVFRDVNRGGSDFVGYQNADNIGVAKAMPYYHPQVEAVVPQYSNLRMHAGNPMYYFTIGSGYANSDYLNSNGYATTGDTPDNVSVSMMLSAKRVDTPLSTDSIMDVTPLTLYVHGGVDFTQFMFVNVPTLWRYTSTASGFLPRIAPETDD